MTYEWRAVLEPIETPGGTFDDCWERFTTDLSIVYCRGIGLVRITNAPSNYVLSLVSKNF